jgi:3-methyladenine DNA glycosylase AlkD
MILRDVPISTPRAALAALRAHGQPRQARALTAYFQAGPGGYAEGDRFLGLRVPEIRAVLRQCELTLPACIELLASKYHEARLLGLLAMVRLSARADDATRRRICAAYLRNTARIDNWDLVDHSAEHIVGAVLHGPDLARLAGSKSVWERRIAMIATFHGIRRGSPAAALRIARVLRRDPHDLIQKAVGWMLREVGKRCDRALLRDFLTAHAATLPRTTLRYAIEHFDAAERKRWMATGKVPAAAKAPKKKAEKRA